MDLTSNIIKQNHFRWLVLGLMSCFVLFTLWAGVKELQTFHSVFEDTAPTEQQAMAYEIGDLALTKTSINTAGQSQVIRYVTVKNLQYRPSQEQRADILKANHGLTKMMGLMGHPSFVVGKDKGFWESQFYLEWGFRFGGWLVFGIMMIAITEINFRQKKKLFTTEIKRLFFGMFWLIAAGFVINAVLYGRMIHFLNTKYYLGESLTRGISSEFVWLMVVFVWIILFFEQAVPMQKEQDLTV